MATTTILFLVLHLSAVVLGQSEPKKCEPDKINQLLKEIMACQAQQQQPPQSQPPPPPPRAPAGPGGFFPTIPRGGEMPPNFLSGRGGGGFPDFLSKGGPSFFSSPSGSGSPAGGGGVLVSRPIPADVRPVQGEGIPSDSQFFIAGPRTRGGGGFPFAIDFGRRGGPGGPAQGPQGDPNASEDPQQGPPQPGQEEEDGNFPSNFFPSLFGGAQPRYDLDSRFGGPPATFGNPFGSPFPSGGGGGPGGNTFSFEISPPGGPNSLGIDFDEILRILKELQAKDSGKDAGKEQPQPGMNPDLDSNTTQGIIDVDTTMDPTTEESESMTTESTQTTSMPSESQ